MSKMDLTRDEFRELGALYDQFALAVERAAATLHMRGIDSAAFAVEDTKCVAVWERLRALMGKVNA